MFRAVLTALCAFLVAVSLSTPANTPQAVSVALTPTVAVSSAAVCGTDAECAALDETPEVPEDSPAFDCSTMGNRTCGVDTVDGGPVLMPAADGGLAYQCPAEAELRDRGGLAVCVYSWHDNV